MYVLDTDILTLLQRGSGDGFAQVAQRLEAAAAPVRVTIVSFQEQMKGWLAYAAKARTPEEYVTAAARLRAALDDFSKREVLDFTPAAADQFRRLKADRVRIGTPDLRIAAIVKSLDATLVTRNLSDFRRVPGLKADDWSRPA